MTPEQKKIEAAGAALLPESKRDAFYLGAISPEAKNYWQKGMYTGKEVLSLLKRIGREITYPETYYEPVDTDENDDKYFNGEVEDWFEQNKKK